MESQNQLRFFQILNTMGEFFGDELSELRQRMYWEICRARLVIEEWEYACLQAMARETFYKVPLPAHLLEYVQEYRATQREEAARQRRMETEEQRLATEGAQRALQSDPKWQVEQEHGWQEAQESLNKLFGANWRTIVDMQHAAERAERKRRLHHAIRMDDDLSFPQEDTPNATAN